MTDISEAFGMSGRVAVVTGAASGIGRECALVLAEAGADIVLADVARDGQAETADHVRERGARAITVSTNVAKRADVDALAEAALNEWGRIDVWVNCAGAVVHKPILEGTEEDIDLLVAVNMKGVYWGCCAAARAMMPNGGGSIINISSSGADSAPPGASIYAMTKAAVNKFTQACAAEFGPSGVRVNAIGPGFIYTPMTRAAKEPDPERREAMLKAMADMSPLRTTGVPRDIAYAVLYLASDASRFMTGQILRPNGGTPMV